MSAFPVLVRSVSPSVETGYVLGDPVVDCYLEFVGGRCRANTLRAVAHDLKTFFTVVDDDPLEVATADVFEFVAHQRLDESHDRWGEKYPAIRTLWATAWSEFVPFLDYSPEIRRVIYSKNAIESLNARFRRATRARGHFPNEQAALNRWKPALNAFAITFEGRLSEALDPQQQ